jgi:hypothetical protein
MGNFFEDLVHSVIESALTEEEQTALKVRPSYALLLFVAGLLSCIKFHKLKREVIEDVRTIFPHG